MEDLYRTLQVDPGADPEVIDAAWRRLAHLYHPDNGLRPDPERMAAINQAHQVLKDPEQRAEYDRRRAQAAPAGAYDGRPAPMGGAGHHEMTWVAAPALKCWRHPGWAVAHCTACRSPLCNDCAVRWQPPHCDRCAIAQGHSQQAWIVWPLAATAAWLTLVFVAYGGGWQVFFAVPLSWRPPLWPTLLVTYVIGAGAVGGVDLLLWLLRTVPSGARQRVTSAARGFLLVLLVPPALLAGSVFAPVRGVMAVNSFVRGTAKVMKARGSLRSGG